MAAAAAKTTAKKTAKKAATPAPAKAAKKPVKASAKKPPDTASSAVDEQLARYRSMRDFHVTAEPSGSS